MKKSKGGADLKSLIYKIEQQMIVLEQKLDLLISRPAHAPAGAVPSPKPFQQVAPVHNHVEVKRENNFRQRVMFKAVCADCRKECEVPFKPSGERPVYCKDCYSKRRGSNMPKARPDNRPVQAASHAIPADKPQTVHKKKAAAKKSAAKKSPTKARKAKK